ncbi:MAG: hypothetical protein JWQ00_2289 [Noviherbaspirillum sp.]|nr:hypothetical protein [Noviherbaspirillum sp.]
MIKFYKELDLDDAIAGMVLSQAIVDRQGGTLLPAATVLTDQLLASLRRRGIDTVCIINDELSEADLQAERGRVQRRLASLFRKSGAGGALLRHVTEYRLGSTK